MKLAFLDTETTGLNIDLHEMWELAFILREDGAPRDSDQEHFFQFRPTDLRGADPASLRISGLYERIEPLLLLEHGSSTAYGNADVARSLEVGVDQQESAWTFIEHRRAAAEICQILNGAVIVGAVPAFDVDHNGGFLTKYIVNHGFAPSWHYHARDIESMLLGHLIGGQHRAEFPALATVEDGYEELVSRVADGLWSQHPHHTALGDARLVRDLWDRMHA